MASAHPTGRYETRPGTSTLDMRRSREIRVFIPWPLQGPFNAGNVEALIDLEQRLADVSTDPELARVGPILTRSEGIASSRIEGLVMSTPRIDEASLHPEDTQDQQAHQIAGNMDVMTDVLKRADRSLTHDDLHRWHTAIVKPESSSRHTAGTYRSVQSWIGGRADTPIGAKFVPPPPGLIPGLMDDLLDFANDRALSPIIQAAIVDAQLETIHPGIDGNGRIGRVLIYRSLAMRDTI